MNMHWKNFKTVESKHSRCAKRKSRCETTHTRKVRVPAGVAGVRHWLHGRWESAMRDLHLEKTAGGRSECYNRKERD